MPLSVAPKLYAGYCPLTATSRRLQLTVTPQAPCPLAAPKDKGTKYQLQLLCRLFIGSSSGSSGGSSRCRRWGRYRLTDLTLNELIHGSELTVF